MERVTELWHKVNRKKTLDDDVMETPLRRCLNTADLTLLGIGQMVGAGIFVLTGTVVRHVAGPATILSYLVAGGAAMLSSLCYAEFGARVPKAGSAYTYVYVTIGEFWSFIVGWNIILEHVIGTASVARAFSASVDAMFNGAIKNGTMTYVGTMHAPWISEYPDFIALLVVLIIAAFIAYGTKISVNFNSICTVINGLVILLIIFLGLSVADFKNWTKERGGFFPYGFPGVFAGAASCFYSYIGFECIAVASEEAKKPEKSVPLSTGVSMATVTLLYVGSSATLTLMVPYYDVDKAAPFPIAFAQRGFDWARYVIAIGALFGIVTSLFGGLYTLPRCVYSMSSDGLFFKIFCYVHPKTQTPIISIATFGGAAGIFAFLFEIDTLVEFLSIGTLFSFTVVAVSILILRYQPASECQFELKSDEEETKDKPSGDEVSEKKPILALQKYEDIGKLKKKFAKFPYLKDIGPGVATCAAVLIMLLFMLLFSVTLLYGYSHVSNADWWAVILLIIFTAGIVISFSVLLFHVQNEYFLTFQVPLVPLIPSVSMFINIAMMVKLSYLTWIRFAVWFGVGMCIYFGYGIRHSKENTPKAAYSHVISYSGPNSEDEVPPKMDEKLHMPQPTNQNNGS